MPAASWTNCQHLSSRVTENGSIGMMLKIEVHTNPLTRCNYNYGAQRVLCQHRVQNCGIWGGDRANENSGPPLRLYLSMTHMFLLPWRALETLRGALWRRSEAGLGEDGACLWCIRVGLLMPLALP